MKITRDVVMDLLPIYLADEASEDSRLLVEEYLAEDPTLAKLVERSKKKQWEGEIPVPLNKEHEMKSFEKTKNLMFQQKLFLAMAIATTLLFAAFRFDSEGVEWLWIHSPEIGWAVFLAMTIFWTAFLNVSHLLNRSA